MSVELKVTLVGEDPQQQAAFNDPTPVASNAPSIPPVQPATLPSPPPVQSSAVASTGGSHSEVTPPPVQSTEPSSQAASIPPPLPAWHVQAPPVQGQEQRLIDSIDQLIESIDALTQVNSKQLSKRNSQGDSESKENTYKLARVVDYVDRKLEEFGIKNTRFGRTVSGVANTVARASKVAGEAETGIARVAGGAASRAAAGAATEAAAGGAAIGAAEAAAGLGAVAAAAAPVAIALVGFGAGIAATVITVKILMDAVESLASELEDLSPQIASVRAQAEVTMELARLDRANRIGGELAGLETANNRLNESMYELQTKIYEIVLKGAPALEMLVDGLNVIIRGIDVGIASVNNGVAQLTINDPKDDIKAQGELEKSIKEMANAINEFRDVLPDMKNDRDPLFDAILGFNQAPKQKAPQQGNGLGGEP